MIKVTVIDDKITKKFDDFAENGRILLFEAPCGFGKTTLAKALLKRVRARVREVQANEADFIGMAAEKSNWDILLVENLHTLTETEEYQNLCSLIKSNPKKRFVFTSRGSISGELIPFRRGFF